MLLFAMMMLMSLDYLIIGGGTAGITLYKSLKSEHKLVKLIDDRLFTTTCARVGCMPSKLLIAAAESCENLVKAKAFGIEVLSFEVHFDKVMQRIQDERDRFLGFIKSDLDDFPPVDLIHSSAKFVANNEVELSDGFRLTALKIIIATGSKPLIPKVFQEFGDKLLTSDNLFDLKTLPKSLAVIGSGIIGLELGQALSQLGIKVKIITRTSSLTQIVDEVVRAKAKEIFASKLDIDFDCEVTCCDFIDDKYHLQILHKNSNMTETEIFDQVLVAAGRIPNLDNLNLQATSVELNDNVPVVSENYECLDKQSKPSGIYMIGDVRDELPLLHLANFDAKALSKILLSKPLLRQPIDLSIVFTSPQMMRVGLSVKQLQDRAIDFTAAEIDFKNQGRSRMFLVNEGMLRVYFDKCSEILLGAEMCGPDAEHFGHFFALAIKNNETKSSLLELPYYHPTIIESLKSILIPNIPTNPA